MLDVLIPRKKRGRQSGKMQPSSLDVLAEVLEKCNEEEDEEENLEEFAEETDGANEFEENLPSSSREQQREKRVANKLAKKRLEPFKFTKCKLRKRHFLKEGQGLAMIQNLGLKVFLLETDIPRFNKNYCIEFISTYNHHKGAGVVNGKCVKITAEAIARLTGLPIGLQGQHTEIHDARSEDIPILGMLIPGLKKTTYGYDLRYLRYGDQTETFVAVASFLSEKLVCRTFKLTYIKAAILLAMEASLRKKITMQWAEFMAESIRNAVKLTKLRTRNVRFAFGEWLTGLIRMGLGDEILEGERGTGLVENAPPTISTTYVASDVALKSPDVAGDVADMPACRSSSDDDVKRLQQKLVDAEIRECWFVATNLDVNRQLEMMKCELSSVKDMMVKMMSNHHQQQQITGEIPSPVTALFTCEGGVEGEGRAQDEDEMQALQVDEASLVTTSFTGEGEGLMNRQTFTGEGGRLKADVQERRKVLGMLRKSKLVPYEAYKETLDAYIALKKEHKRLLQQCTDSP